MIIGNRNPKWELELGIPVWRVEMESRICEASTKLAPAFRCVLILGVAAVALMVVAMPAAAQTSYGSMVGTVTDASSSNIRAPWR